MEKQDSKDITLTQEEFYGRLKGDADISTSQPSPADVTGLWDRLLEEYDQVVHIPMSSGLSSSCETAMALSMDEAYEGKVFVVDNQRVSVTQYQSVKDALMLAAQGADGARIKERLEETKGDSVIFITVDTLKYLKKGADVDHPGGSGPGTLLRKDQAGAHHPGVRSLDAFAKARTMKQARTLMLNSIQKELETRLGDSQCQYSHLAIAHTQNAEAAEEFRKELQEKYPCADVMVAPLSLSVSCHIGTGKPGGGSHEKDGRGI